MLDGWVGMALVSGDGCLGCNCCSRVMIGLGLESCDTKVAAVWNAWQVINHLEHTHKH